MIRVNNKVILLGSSCSKGSSVEETDDKGSHPVAIIVPELSLCNCTRLLGEEVHNSCIHVSNVVHDVH